MPFLKDPNAYSGTGLEKLQESGKYFDLTIKSNNREYHVHKAIVCSRSDFFDAACSSSFIEARTNIIDLSEDDEEAVEHMIHYFYHLDYTLPKRFAPRRNSTPTSPKQSPRPFRRARRRSIKVRSLVFEDPLLAQALATTPITDASFAAPVVTEDDHDSKLCPEADDEDADMVDSIENDENASSNHIDTPEVLDDAVEQPPEDELVHHASVYAIAEKYGIPGLKLLARHKFLAQLSAHVPFVSFASALAEVYVSTIDSDRGLRDPMLQLFRQHPELVHRSDVQDVMGEVDNSSVEIERVISGMPVR